MSDAGTGTGTKTGTGSGSGTGTEMKNMPDSWHGSNGWSQSPGWAKVASFPGESQSLGGCER